MTIDKNTSWIKAPGLIRPPEMLPLLVEACPSFEPEWKQFQTEWEGEANQPYYLALADFARHLSLVLKEGEEQALRGVFGVLERLIIEGDPYVREAAIVGLIEDLQNTNLHSGTTPEQYLPFLLPKTNHWWKKVEAFWAEGQLLTDD